MLMQIDGTFIFVIISFLIFLFIIKAILFNPITKVIDERDNFYAKNSKMELESKEKAKALIEQKQKALSETKKEASELISTTSKQAKEQSSNELKQAQKEAANTIDNNKNELIEQKRLAKIEAKADINTIVSSIVSKILNEDITVNVEEDKMNSLLKL